GRHAHRRGDRRPRRPRHRQPAGDLRPGGRGRAAGGQEGPPGAVRDQRGRLGRRGRRLVRREFAEARRVVVKVGSSSLTTVPGGLDLVRLTALVDVLSELRAAGREVVLVSSGAIAAGLAPLGLATWPPLRPRRASANCASCRPTPTRSPGTASPWGRCCSPPTTSPDAA